MFDGSVENVLFSEGVGHLKHGEFILAEKAFKNLTIDYPKNFKGWIGRFLCEFRRKQNKDSIASLKEHLSQADAPQEVQQELDFKEFPVMDWEAVDSASARIFGLEKEKEEAREHWQDVHQRLLTEIEEQKQKISDVDKASARHIAAKKTDWLWECVGVIIGCAILIVPAYPLCYFLLRFLIHWSGWFIPAVVWTAYMAWIMRACITPPGEDKELKKYKDHKDALMRELDSLILMERAYSSETEKNTLIEKFESEIAEEEQTIAKLNPTGMTIEEYEKQVNSIIRRCMQVLERGET